MMKKIDMLCIGNPMFDMFASVNEPFLEKFSLTEPVQHISWKQMEALFVALEESGIKPSWHDGGGAANTARAAVRLGLKTKFSGRVYPTRTGAFLKLKCGEKIRIAASPRDKLTLYDLEALFAKVGIPRVIYVEGFLMNRAGLVERCFEYAQENDAVFAFDCGTAAIAREYASVVAEWLQHDQVIVFANEDEASELKINLTTNHTDHTNENFSSSVREVGEVRGLYSVLVTKLGSRGADVCAGGEVFRAPAEPLAVADATGAGDAFAAGFLAAHLAGASPLECGRAGNAAAREFLLQ
jgi:sugar/nucleoside kinase (ribokinase family)